MTSKQLDVSNHDRDSTGMRYVYAVVSRRAEGVSLGINLNPNHACNWRCIYCQVPELKRGVAPDIDLDLLQDECKRMLQAMVAGSFMDERVPTRFRRLSDIAISGNGEPTSCRQFAEVVSILTDMMHHGGVGEDVRLRLITNGSYVHRPAVMNGLKQMAAHRGEVWLKVDAGRTEDIKAINGVGMTPERLRRQVELAASLCPTWIQSCFFSRNGRTPDATFVDAYLGFLHRLVMDGVPIKGVLLYGLARPSMQPQAATLGALSGQWLRKFSERIAALGLDVRVFP